MQHNYNTAAGPFDRLRTGKGFRLPKFLYPADAQRVLDVAAAMPSSERFVDAFRARYAALATLYYTAIRRAECIGLDVGDLQFEERVIRILGKGNKERLVPMHPDLEVILRAYLCERLQPRNGDALFVSYHRRRISSGTVQRWIKQIGSEAALAWIHPHTFRHTLATRVLKTSKNLRILQVLLGHSNIGTTAIYTHCDIQEIAEAVKAAL